MLDFYNKHKPFSGAVEDAWRREVAKLVSLADEYETNTQTWLAHFVYWLKPTRQDWQFYEKRKAPDITWTTLRARFEARFHSETNCATVSLGRRSLRFETFRMKCQYHTEAFKTVVSEVENFVYLGNEEEQSNYTMCSVQWTAVEGMEWNLHALYKQGVQEDFTKSAEEIAHSITKFELFNSSRKLY